MTHPYRERREGDVVYLMRRADGMLKIGKTNYSTLEKRQLAAKRSTGQSVVILSTVPGFTKLELELHEKFDEHRIYNRQRLVAYTGRVTNANYKTEWFHPASEIYSWFDEFGDSYDVEAIKAQRAIEHEIEGLKNRRSELLSELAAIDERIADLSDGAKGDDNEPVVWEVEPVA